MNRLRTLKLRHCMGTDTLLKELANSLEPLHLTCFELAEFAGDVRDGAMDIMVRFLNSFQRLEKMFLLWNEARDFTEEYWDSISHHNSTLKQLVHHQRDTETDYRGNAIILGDPSPLPDWRILHIRTSELKSRFSTVDIDNDDDPHEEFFFKQHYAQRIIDHKFVLSIAGEKG
ncbi:hypothetical protein F5884DRAFT_905481 [Xylogone sp. PMI_703]|nr:hypothetical protein F5884DRAFT_905481 [Xylogone sp. PMI_703]